LLLLIGSGGGLLTALVGSIFVLAGWKLWTLAATLPLTGLVTGLVIASMKTAIPEVQNWVVKMFPISSVTTRVQFWKDTLELLQNHYITGLGIGHWFELYLPYTPWPIMNPHNSYLQLYTDTGLLGGIAMITAGVIFLSVGWNILRSSTNSTIKGIAVGVIGSVVAGMVNAIFEVNTSAPILGTDKKIVSYIAIPYLWFFAAFLAVIYYRVRKESTGKTDVKTVMP
jgi:O-antigen ligase